MIWQCRAFSTEGLFKNQDTWGIIAALRTMSMLSVNEARDRILSQFHPVKTETLPLADSLQRVLAQDVRAENDLPLFDNSSMDGFVLRAQDVSGAAPASPRRLRVVADIPAGSSPTVSLAAGEAA